MKKPTVALSTAGAQAALPAASACSSGGSASPGGSSTTAGQASGYQTRAASDAGKQLLAAHPDPGTGQLVTGGVVKQTRQVLANLRAVVGTLGASLDDALMARVYLTDFGDFEAFDADYVRWFSGSMPSGGAA